MSNKFPTDKQVTKAFEQVIERFKEKFTLQRPLEVIPVGKRYIVLNGGTVYGYVTIPDKRKKNNKAHIYIAIKQPISVIKQTLGHELAHIVIYDELETCCDYLGLYICGDVK